MDVVGKVGYDSAFTFIYSKRSGTPAAAKENQVPEEVVKDRFDRLLAQVQELHENVLPFEEGTGSISVVKYWLKADSIWRVPFRHQEVT